MNKKLKTQKEILQKQLNDIVKQEEKAIIEKYYPFFKNKYEGKFFKVRNTYGGDSKGWWLYIKVTEINPDDVYDTGGNGITSRYKGWQFETTGCGAINISPKDFGYCHTLGQQISEDEFNTAWNKMLENLDALP